MPGQLRRANCLKKHRRARRDASADIKRCNAPAQAGGPIGRLYEIEIELPDFTTRSYRRSTSRKRSKKSRKVVSKTTSSSKSPNREPGVNQVVKTIEMKPKRAGDISATRQPKPESRHAAQKRVQENARKLQMPLF